MRLDLRTSDQQKAAALLAGPVTVVCASAPELSGNYSIADIYQKQANGVVAKINSGMGLPGGGTTFDWQGRPWPADKFLVLAGEVADFVYHAIQVLQGHGAVLPSPTLIVP